MIDAFAKNREVGFCRGRVFWNNELKSGIHVLPTVYTDVLNQQYLSFDSFLHYWNLERSSNLILTYWKFIAYF